MAAKKKFYAVARGRATGVFSKWFGPGGAEEQVRGFAGARYKGFATLAEAEAFLKANGGPGSPPTARPQRGKKPQVRKTTGTDDRRSPPDRGRRVVVYTDGGALHNPGPGGYGVVIANGDRGKELSRGFRLTTNNRMELLACIAGLSEFSDPTAVLLYSDSKYVVDGITKGWARRWRAKGWMRTANEPALNADLWERLLNLCEFHDVKFQWVKGHAGVEGNERCDILATRAAAGSNLAVDAIYEESRKR